MFLVRLRVAGPICAGRILRVIATQVVMRLVRAA
jgi:hypothetical protein